MCASQPTVRARIKIVMGAEAGKLKAAVRAARAKSTFGRSRVAGWIEPVAEAGDRPALGQPVQQCVFCHVGDGAQVGGKRRDGGGRLAVAWARECCNSRERARRK